MTEQRIPIGARIHKWLFAHKQWVSEKQIIEMGTKAGFSRATIKHALVELTTRGSVVKEGRVGSNGKGCLWYRWNDVNDPNYLIALGNKWWNELPEIPVCWPDGSPAKRVEPLPALTVKKPRRRG